MYVCMHAYRSVCTHEYICEGVFVHVCFCFLLHNYPWNIKIQCWGRESTLITHHRLWLGRLNYLKQQLFIFTARRLMFIKIQSLNLKGQKLAMQFENNLLLLSAFSEFQLSSACRGALLASWSCLKPYTWKWNDFSHVIATF